MDRASNDLPHVSLPLSKVLDDVGASWEMMVRRRRTYLLYETTMMVFFKLVGRPITSYVFGSQTEGTTTPGLGSDLDILYCKDNVNVMQEWSDWKAGKLNLLAIKEVTTPPRHRTLQMIGSDSPEPVTEIDENYVRDKQGRVLLKSTVYHEERRNTLAKHGMPMIIEGPSASWTKDIDLIDALRLKTLPPECMEWVGRARPGHWPTPEMLENAKQLGCFLLPVDSPESMLSDKVLKVQWRLSPSLIERLCLV